MKFKHTLNILLLAFMLVITSAVSFSQANQLPIADAGPDQNVTDFNAFGTVSVTLNGSASYDPDGNITAYTWLRNGVIIGTSKVANANFGVGVHNVTLRVTDNLGALGFDEVKITVNPAPANIPPVANAGPDRNVTDANGDGVEIVVLDGSLSFDTDGTIVSYVWRENGVILGNSSILSRNFAVGTHTVVLNVTDNRNANSIDVVIVNVNSAPNIPPIADAGPDQNITAFIPFGVVSVVSVVLNGSASFDPDGNITLYNWTENGLSIGLGAAITRNISVGIHNIILTVRDNLGAYASDGVVIKVAQFPNLGPIANAGPDQNVTDLDGNGLESVVLNGSISILPVGNVSFTWLENGAIIATNSPATVDLTIGTHIITLRVNFNGDIVTDDLVVIVNPLPGNLIPVANAGPDKNVTDLNGDGRELVILNGSLSYDADGNITSYSWMENGIAIGTGQIFMANLTVGTHNVTLRVTDDRNAVAFDGLVVVVKLQKLTASDGTQEDYFGHSASLYQDYALLSSVNDNSGRGSAYIFKRNGNSWQQQSRIAASDGVAQDGFGHSTSIYGDYAIISSPLDNNGKGIDAGSAYIFKRSGSSWTQQSKLIANDGRSSALFGSAVAIYGNYAIIGSQSFDSKGAAYIFKRNGNSWTQQARIAASDTEAVNLFGSAVAIYGDYAIVGAYGSLTQRGSAYIFKRSGNAWTQQAKLTAPDRAVADNFGYSVSISADKAVVGSYRDDDKGTDSGSVYVFRRSGNAWNYQSKLTASDGASGDNLGYSVSLSGNTLLASSKLDDDKGTNSGSAYLYQLS